MPKSKSHPLYFTFRACSDVKDALLLFSQEVKDKQSSKALEKFQRLIKDMLHGRKADAESKGERTAADSPAEEDEDEKEEDEKEEEEAEEEDKVADEVQEAGEKDGKGKRSKPKDPVSKVAHFFFIYNLVLRKFLLFCYRRTSVNLPCTWTVWPYHICERPHGDYINAVAVPDIFSAHTSVVLEQIRICCSGTAENLLF